MTRPKLIEQLKKLRTLAARNTNPHESDTAQQMFDSICEKNGITPDELMDVREVRWFIKHSDYERRLLQQIIASVLDCDTFTVWKNKRKRNHIGVELSHAEYIKIERLYRIYTADLKKEMERTYRAFLASNSIYPESLKSDSDQELTPDELAELKRIVAMAAVIDVSRVHAELR